MAKLAFPDGETSPERAVDLYCRPRDDRRLVLWKRAVPVVPVSDFQRIGKWIQSGHYVIDYEGDAIVVHCGNRKDRMISVQFMIGDPVAYPMPRRTIQSMLLGRLVVSEAQRAAVFERKRLGDLFKDHDASNRPGGRRGFKDPGTSRCVEPGGMQRPST